VDLDKAVSELLLTLGKSFAWHCCKEIMLGMSQAGPNIFMMQGLQKGQAGLNRTIQVACDYVLRYFLVATMNSPLRTNKSRFVFLL
jgi:hypothetical protein